MKLRIFSLTTALLAGASLLPAQAVNNMTAAGLGFPIPIPVSSVEPVNGFRTADALMTRFTTLALDKDFITASSVGSSIRGRTITAYRFSTADANTPEGTPKGSAMIQGTIHPREWQSPETAAAVFEWLALESETDPIAAFLLENMEIVILPIGNPDGFIMTQLFPDQTIDGGASGAGGRDGRMRRKNMRGADEVLSTIADYTSGVDLNRNHAFGFSASSSDPTSITYRGASPGSEPESQALYAAADLLDTARLRLYVDIHSHLQLYYSINDSSTSRNAAVLAAYEVMRDASFATTGRFYSNSPTDLATQSIGATDEYFTGTFRAMSYTLETRPQIGETPNGFVPSNSSIAEIREEVLSAVRNGFYYAAGPAVLQEIRFYDTTNGETPAAPLVYREVREVQGGARVRNVTEPGPLRTSRNYTAALVFSKPMRLASAQNPATGSMLTGIAPNTPHVSIEGALNSGLPRIAFENPGEPFGYSRYPGDTMIVEFNLRPTNLPGGDYTFVVEIADAAGKGIDADPLTIADWSAQGWTNWESQTGLPGLTGGPDRATILTVLNDTLDASNLWHLY